MGEHGFKKYEEYNHDGIAAFFFMTAEGRSPQELARAVAEINHEVEVPWGVQVLGVRWTAVVQGSYDVVAAVRVESQQDLDKLQADIEEAGGRVNPSAQIASDFFIVRRGQNSLP